MGHMYKKGGKDMSEEKNVKTSGESQDLKRGIKGWQVSFIGLGV